MMTVNEMAPWRMFLFRKGLMRYRKYEGIDLSNVHKKKAISLGFDYNTIKVTMILHGTSLKL